MDIPISDIPLPGEEFHGQNESEPEPKSIDTNSDQPKQNENESVDLDESDTSSINRTVNETDYSFDLKLHYSESEQSQDESVTSKLNDTESNSVASQEIEIPIPNQNSNSEQNTTVTKENVDELAFVVDFAVENPTQTSTENLIEFNFPETNTETLNRINLEETKETNESTGSNNENVEKPTENVEKQTENMESSETSDSDLLSETRIVESITEEQFGDVIKKSTEDLIRELEEEIKDQPIVSYESSESESESNNFQNPNSNQNQTEIIIIEEIKFDSTELSSNASPQMVPIVEEQDEKTATELEEEANEEMTEVLVLETVSEAVAVETDNTTTVVVEQKEVFVAATVQKQEVEEPKLAEKKKIDKLKESIYIELSDKEKTKSTPKPRGRPRTRDAIQARRKEDDVLVPCHVLGRSVDNPTEDFVSNGRAPPKPRLGVKVPYRFLTSQIVTKQEITEEVLEHVAKRNASLDPPAGGDIFFAKKLTERLANKIASNENKKNIASATIAATATTTTTTTTAAATVSPKQTPIVKSAPINDNLDLLALLEGNVDVDWTKEVEHVNLSKLTSTSPNTSLKHSDGLAKKMDPEMERMIALKQLQELPKECSRPRGRGRGRGRKSLSYSASLKSKTQEPLKRKEIKIEKIKEEKMDQIGKTVPEEETTTATQPDDFEPTLTPKRVTKTYSRKEALLQIPEDLEYIVNETETANEIDSVNVETKEIEESNKTTDESKTKTKKDVIVLKKSKRIEPEVTLVSKRSRIIKKKIIWDPAEVTVATKPVQLKKRGRKPKIVIEVKPETEKKEEKEIETKIETETKIESEIPVPRKPSLTKVKKVKKILMKQPIRSFPMKKLGRPLKKKSLVLSKKTKINLRNISKAAKPKKTELDKLLMDEGAVNMLYPEAGHKRNKSVISLDRAQRDFINRVKAVKDKITQSSSQEDSAKTLRKKESPQSFVVTLPVRKKSRDSVQSSIHSPPPSPGYIYAHRAEASRIIRRHSSSFSSECSSPRRLSIDAQQQQQQQPPPPEQPQFTAEPANEEKPKPDPELQSPIITRVLRRKSGVPIYERKSIEKTYKGKKKLMAEMESVTPTGKERLTKAEKRKLNTEMSKNFSKPETPRKLRRLSKMLQTDEEQLKNNGDEKIGAEAENGQKLFVDGQGSINSSYKEICLKKMDNLMQIILTPTSTKLKNPMNLQMFRELCDVLSQLSSDETCRVVLITSIDSSFCHGVDFSALIQPTNETRLAIAQEMADALKKFVHDLASFPKPLVAGVQGSAVGLGVTMLPLFDLVLASDKATFSTPYGRLGHVPEGLVSLTLPHLLGNNLVKELLFANRKLTASEALNHGLVTRILWPDKFQEELISNTLTIVNQSPQCMIATKSLLRQSLLNKLDEALETESKLLVEHWTSVECQQNFKKLLDEDEWW